MLPERMRASHDLFFVSGDAEFTPDDVLALVRHAYDAGFVFGMSSMTRSLRQALTRLRSYEPRTVIPRNKAGELAGEWSEHMSAIRTALDLACTNAKGDTR